MANKFQRSVQERLEEEARRQTAGKKIEQAKTSPPTEPPTPEEEPAAVMEPQKETLPPVSDISQYLRPESQRIAKNKTFYLDSDVIGAVKATAKAQHVTDSKLVNDILRRVLGL